MKFASTKAQRLIRPYIGGLSGAQMADGLREGMRETILDLRLYVGDAVQDAADNALFHIAHPRHSFGVVLGFFDREGRRLFPDMSPPKVTSYSDPFRTEIRSEWFSSLGGGARMTGAVCRCTLTLLPEEEDIDDVVWASYPICIRAGALQWMHEFLKKDAHTSRSWRRTYVEAVNSAMLRAAPSPIGGGRGASSVFGRQAADDGRLREAWRFVRG